jgi:hypothetical protein
LINGATPHRLLRATHEDPRYIVGPKDRFTSSIAQKTSVEEDPIQKLRYVRRRARRIGIAIRKQRATRGSWAPLYRLLDRDTGEVIRRDLRLDDVPKELSSIIRHRGRAGLRPAAESPDERCPSCRARRTGFLRYCTFCGFDFHPRPRPNVLLQASQPPTVATLGATGEDTGQAPQWWRRYRVASRFEIAVGAAVGALIGVIAIVVGARS